MCYFCVCVCVCRPSLGGVLLVGGKASLDSSSSDDDTHTPAAPHMRALPKPKHAVRPVRIHVRQRSESNLASEAGFVLQGSAVGPK